jgi:hypothetical protein
MSPGWRATGLPRYCLRCDATVSPSCRIGIAGAVVAVALVTPVLASTRADATTRSAAAQSVPACGTRALVVTVSSNGAGGKVLIYVGLRNRGRHACLARGHAGLALRDAATPALLHVYGNPYGRAVHRSLRRGPNTSSRSSGRTTAGRGGRCSSSRRSAGGKPSSTTRIRAHAVTYRRSRRSCASSTFPANRRRRARTRAALSASRAQSRAAGSGSCPRRSG